MTEQGVAKTVDFGIAETLSRTLSPREAREILGTIPYLAPEVIGGSSPSPASDTYSLALTLYELIAGRLPFSGANAAASTGQRLANAAPPLRTFAGGASPEIETVLARALAITPADRFASVGDFGAALAASQERRARSLTQPAPLPVIVRRQAPAPVHATAVRYETARVSPRGRGPGAGPFVAVLIGGALVIGGGIALAVGLSQRGGDSPSPTPTPVVATTTPTARASVSPTTPAPTASSTQTATATGTASPTLTPTTPSATATRTMPATATRTNTPGSPTAGPSAMATATKTP